MSSKSKLRACMLCSYVQSAQTFKREGCPNCEDLLRMKGSGDKVLECTSGTFDGTCALINPSESWVGKWQRTNSFRPGIYAIRISGVLPEAIAEDLEDRGVKVRGRHDD